ncbi:MAG: hypothetical protein H6865_00550 [Rhodospirillales bacterium]|nr:hypothetical protein [Alphaproteobacteria bacterium]MCB1538377.1 hypothetical protein [Alphaproteobacteria bacterium]MCB9986116.1 hypothetical protein [Rhodospirillales bacterium]USO07324.1 MAG: hypothetical protein H6866_07825 [Rhodospirillales bacterium]
MTDDANVIVAFPRAPRTGMGSPATIFAPDDFDDAQPALPDHLRTDFLLRIAAEHDALMFHGFGPAFYDKPDVPGFASLEAVRILMGRPIGQFLRAVWTDDLAEVMRLSRGDLAAQIRLAMREPQFFFMHGSSDVCFVGPAHLTRSLTMAMLLGRMGARFDMPDSEGRLPQHYWARHARDAALFAYGEIHLGMDMRRGAMHARIPHDTPIWTALEAHNPHAAKGLALCRHAGVNEPRMDDPCRTPPLMVLAAGLSERLIHAGRVRRGILRGLWTVCAFARGPEIDWDQRDSMRHALADLALAPEVAQLLVHARARPYAGETPLGFRPKLA